MDAQEISMAIAGVDDNLADAMKVSAKRIADAISADAAPGTDATGGHINSLTEAVMGVTSGLVAIASALESVAEAIRETGRR